MLEVTLVSGGNGGNGGSGTQKTQTYVISGNGNITADDNNIVSVILNGLATWIIPDVVKNKTFLMSACGGSGGGYSAMNGGTGADGFAKIKFMTTEANCTTVKTELAYNDFFDYKNGFFTKIKLAFLKFKDFIIALFNPQVKCKTCMK